MTRADEDTDVSHSLANRLVATLDDRPFRPSPAQLLWVSGGTLDRSSDGESLARIAGARFAGLVAGHVVQDVAAPGGPGAYALIWLCARRAFVQNANAEP